MFSLTKIFTATGWPVALLMALRTVAYVPTTRLDVSECDHSYDVAVGWLPWKERGRTCPKLVIQQLILIFQTRGDVGFFRLAGHGAEQ